MSFIVNRGTETEAVVRGAGRGDGVHVEVEDGTDSTAVSFYVGYLDQGGLHYPSNLLVAEGRHVLQERELTPLEQLVRELLTKVMDRYGSSIGAESFPWRTSIDGDPLPEGIRVSKPLFGEVRRPSWLSGVAARAGEELFEVLAEGVRADRLAAARLTYIDGRPPKSVISPTTELERLGSAAAREDEAGRTKGFFVQTLSSYPGLLEHVMHHLDSEWVGDVPPSTPTLLTLEEAWQNISGQNPVLPMRDLGSFNLFRLLKAALTDPTATPLLSLMEPIAGVLGSDEIDVQGRRLSALVWNVFAIAHEIESFEIEGVGPWNFAVEVRNVYEEAGRVDVWLAVREVYTEYVQGLLELFPADAEAIQLERSKAWPLGHRISRSTMIGKARPILEQLEPAEVELVEALVEVEEQVQQQRQEDQQRQRRAHSLTLTIAFWVKPDTLQPSVPISRRPYEDHRGSVAKEKIYPDESFFEAAYQTVLAEHLEHYDLSPDDEDGLLADYGFQQDLHHEEAREAADRALRDGWVYVEPVPGQWNREDSVIFEAEGVELAAYLRLVDVVVAHNYSVEQDTILLSGDMLDLQHPEIAARSLPGFLSVLRYLEERAHGALKDL